MIKLLLLGLLKNLQIFTFCGESTFINNFDLRFYPAGGTMAFSSVFSILLKFIFLMSSMVNYDEDDDNDENGIDL